MTAFTVRVPDETADKLDKLAEKLDRSRAYVAAQAIEDFVNREAGQLSEIEAGLAEADSGDFATDAELARVIGKYVSLQGQASVGGKGGGAACFSCRTISSRT